MNKNKNELKKTELKKAIDFFEELVWLFDSRRNLKLKEVPMSLRLLVDSNDSDIVSDKFKSSNPNIHFLIGILPRLFKDEVLFPNNNSIAQFAEEVLNIKVSRAEKRSKYELIGLIVCETDTLSDGQLNELVKALSKLAGNDDHLKQIKEIQNRNNFSWNETIKQLTEINNE